MIFIKRIKHFLHIIIKYYKLSIISIIIIIITIAFLISQTTLLNKQYKATYNVVFHDCSIVPVIADYSDPRYIQILPHFYGLLLGKEEKDKFIFNLRGKQLFRETYYRPIIINEIYNQIYIVEWDRETDFSKIIFRFYKYNNGNWEDYDYTQFPKEIAIQNISLSSRDKDILSKMDFEDIWFKDSLTGKLWILLEKGKQYYETEYDDSYPPSFFAEFKEKYIIKKETPETELTPKNKNPQSSGEEKKAE